MSTSNCDLQETDHLVFTLQQQIFSDDTNQSKQLIQHYNNESPEMRKVYDKIFLCLCGWTFTSLHKKALQSERQRLYCEVSNTLFRLKQEWEGYSYSDTICRAHDVLKWVDGELSEGAIQKNLSQEYASKIEALNDVKESVNHLDEQLEVAI